MRPALTTADRCDRCGAQAHAVTLHGEHEFLWCGHHYREHESKIASLLIFMTPEFATQRKDPAKT
jgi:hypothetical protein